MTMPSFWSSSLLLFSCIPFLTMCTSPQANQPDPTQAHPAANLSNDLYQPGPGWTLVWADEFEGDSLKEDNWNRQVVPAGRFNKEWQAYTDSTRNASVEDGCLVIKAIHQGGGHGHDRYTSARLNTAGKQSWKYGKFAARIQLPHGKGIWPAFWTLGANCTENGGDTPWPFCGEIDILELYGSKNDAVVEANIHYANLSDKHEQLHPVPHYKLQEGIFADRFHIFEIEWDAEKIVWIVDGRPYHSTDISTPDRTEFHHEHFILLNIAVGGLPAGRPDHTTPFPQFMYVDWVRVYQKAKG